LKKAIRILVRPGLNVMDAEVWDVTADAIGLILESALPAGTVVAILDRMASLSESRVLSGRVVSATPWGTRGWLVNCRLSVRLRDHELRGFLG
jgi:hypothetical protein